MFERIMKTHPLDYYWLWTDENWTWSPVTQQQIDAVMGDFRGGRGGGEGEGPVHAGHVRLGAGAAAKPGLVRQIAAEADGDGLHQSRGGQHAG